MKKTWLFLWNGSIITSKKHGLRCSDKNSLSSRKSQAKGETSKDENGPSCFGCGKHGHLRSECPDLIKSKGKASSSDKSRGRIT